MEWTGKGYMREGEKEGRKLGQKKHEEGEKEGGRVRGAHPRALPGDPCLPGNGISEESFAYCSPAFRGNVMRN